MSTRSPISRVFSIEADGMKKAWIAKDLMISASTSAITPSTGSSTRALRRLGRLPGTAGGGRLLGAAGVVAAVRP